MRPALLAELSQASPDQAARLVAAVPTDGLVRLVRASADADLDVVIGHGPAREAVTATVLRRLPELVLPERLRGVSGTARLELEHGDRVVARHALVLEAGRLGHTLDVPADHPADVSLRTSALRFVRLVTGQVNAGLAYLSGTLDITGDTDLALALGGMFPSADGSGPVDPRALDPVDVAGVVGRVSAEHLRSVMASGFREVVLDEVFARLPDFVNARKAAGLRVTIGFRITGRPDGGVDRYVVALADGRATVTSGPATDTSAGRVGSVGARDATVTCDAGDFLRLVTGHLGAVTGVLRGQLKVRGDKVAALRLNAAFDIPTAVA